MIHSVLDVCSRRRAHTIVTDLTAAGYVVKQEDGRRNRYQIRGAPPLPEPASKEPAISAKSWPPRVR